MNMKMRFVGPRQAAVYATTALAILAVHPATSAAEAVPASSTSSDTASAAPPNEVAAVIVTAEKKAESSLSVPMGLTTLSGKDLLQSQAFRFEDYAGTVPGLNLISASPLGSQLVIRGITGTINSSVATYIDETPYTGQGIFGASTFIAPNLDTFDMQRIEVLKGPQGTLYGANALGGLLKYVTNAPDPTRFAAAAEGGVSTVYNGGVGYDFHAMMNIPVSDKLALRLVGYDNYYPGFIDDPSRNLNDINGSRFEGGRASLLYEASPSLTIRLSGLYQKRLWDDYDNEDVHPKTLVPVYGDYIQERPITEGEPGQATNQVYNLTINWNSGVVKIMSSSSYSDFNNSSVIDLSPLYGPILQADLHAPFGAGYLQTYDVKSYTEELRFSSEDVGKLQWQFGGYFNKQDTSYHVALYPVNLSTGQIIYNYPTSVEQESVPTTYREFAGFADVDYFIVPKFDIALGGRYSANNQTYNETATGLFFGKGVNFSQDSSQGVFTYSADARWHVTTNNMLYARISSGFVPGGPNDVNPVNPVPSSYSSSTTTNYEGGVKGSYFHNHLSAELSIYDIEWSKIQLIGVVGGFAILTNGGSARSTGFEWNTSYVPIAGLTLGFNGAYDDARLTQATPPSAGGHVGDQLQGVPLWQASATADYERRLTGDYSGFVGATWKFTGDRYGALAAANRQKLPSFSIVDLRAGVKSERWTFEIYVQNVGNTIAINYLSSATLSGTSGTQSASLYTPRTVGGMITARF